MGKPFRSNGAGAHGELLANPVDLPRDHFDAKTVDTERHCEVFIDFDLTKPPLPHENDEKLWKILEEYGDYSRAEILEAERKLEERRKEVTRRMKEARAKNMARERIYKDPKPRQSLREEIVRLRRTGLSDAEVARIVGRSERYVRINIRDVAAPVPDAGWGNQEILNKFYARK